MRGMGVRLCEDVSCSAVFVFCVTIIFFLCVIVLYTLLVLLVIGVCVCVSVLLGCCVDGYRSWRVWCVTISRLYIGRWAIGLQIVGLSLSLSFCLVYTGPSETVHIYILLVLSLLSPLQICFFFVQLI